jgi:hypothetical protein
VKKQGLWWELHVCMGETSCQQFLPRRSGIAFGLLRSHFECCRTERGVIENSNLSEPELPPSKCTASFFPKRRKSLTSSSSLSSSWAKGPFWATTFLRSFCQIRSSGFHFGFRNNIFFSWARSSAFTSSPQPGALILYLCLPVTRWPSYIPRH